MGRLAHPRPLSERHVLENFDCGDDVLNEWLKKFALTNNRANFAKTCDAHEGYQKYDGNSFGAALTGASNIA